MHRRQHQVGNTFQQSTFFKAGLSGDGPLSHSALAAALSFSMSDIADEDSTMQYPLLSHNLPSSQPKHNSQLTRVQAVQTASLSVRYCLAQRMPDK